MSPIQQQVAPEFDKTPIFNRMIEGFGDFVRADQKQKAAEMEKQVVDAFLEKEGKIQTARASGQWDTSRASMASKANFYEFISSNSQYMKALKEARANLYEGTATGDVDKEIEEEKARMKEITRKLDSAGYSTFPGQSQESILQTLRAVDEDTRAEQEMRRADAALKRLDEAAARGDAQAAREAKALRDKNKDEAWKLTNSLVDNHLEAFSARMSDIRSGNYTPEQAQAIAAEEYAKMEALADRASGPDDPDFGKRAIAPFEEIYKLTLEHTKPGAKTEQTEDEVKRLLAMAKLQHLRDPGVARDVAASMLVPTDPLLFSRAGDAVVKNITTLEKLGAGTAQSYNTAPVIGSPAEKTTLDTLKEAMKSSGLKTPTVDGDKGLKDTVDGVLKQTSSIVKAGAPPAVLGNVATFYASNEFGQLSSAGKLSEQALEEANVAMDAYRSSVRANIDRGFAEAAGDSLRGTPSPLIRDSVNLEFKNGKVVFVPVDNLKWSEQAADKMRVHEEALTRLFRISAHMERTQDYAKFFEERKHILLPDLYADPKRLPVGFINPETGERYNGGVWSNPKNWSKPPVEKDKK